MKKSAQNVLDFLLKKEFHTQYSQNSSMTQRMCVLIIILFISLMVLLLMYRPERVTYVIFFFYESFNESF